MIIRNRTFRYMATFFGMFAALFVTAGILSPVYAQANRLDVEYKVYIPHLTGGLQDWTDTLVVNNKGPLLQTFTVSLFNAGLPAGSESFLVQPNGEEAIDIKSINMNATLGIVEYKSQYLTFRMDYQHVNGGLAEFRLSENIYSQSILNFSNIFPGVVETKGLAVANFEDRAATVTMTAIGANRQVLGSEMVALNRRSRIVGLYTSWFPNIAFDDITAIIVSSADVKLGGIVISSNLDISSLLFTQADDASTFTTERFSDQVTIEDYFPDKTLTYEGGEGETMTYSRSSGNVTIHIQIDEAFFRQMNFQIDGQGALRYQSAKYPWGQKQTSSSFEIIPAEVDLNRSFSKTGTWDSINKFNSSDSNITGMFEVAIEGPFYMVFDSGTFPGLLKVQIIEKLFHNHFESSEAVSYDFITLWLSKEFGPVKVMHNGFVFESSFIQEQ